MPQSCQRNNDQRLHDALSLLVGKSGSSIWGMNPLPPAPACPDVPAHVFEEFISALAKAKESPELINRFRKTLQEEKTFTERALKETLFGEDRIS